MSTAARIEAVSKNHPNRGGNRGNNAGANPTPAQVLKLRTDAGLTQTEFGDLVYKNWRTVQNWESTDPAVSRRMPPDTWELVQLKLRARELIKRGRIAPLVVRDLGMNLPDQE